MSTLPEHAHRSPAGGLPHPVDRGGTWATGGGHAITLPEALAERDRLRRESTAMAEALTVLAHDFDPGPVAGRCHYTLTDPEEVLCWESPDAPVHRTPARVRAELEGRP